MSRKAYIFTTPADAAPSIRTDGDIALSVRAGLHPSGRPGYIADVPDFVPNGNGATLTLVKDGYTFPLQRARILLGPVIANGLPICAPDEALWAADDFRMVKDAVPVPPVPPVPPPPPDVIIIPGSPNALTFPVTATVTKFALVPGRMTIHSQGTDAWPALTPGNPSDPDGQAGTLWLFLTIGGKLYAGGAERLRKFQLNGDKPEAAPGDGLISTLVGGGWLTPDKYTAPVGGYNPHVGERVGLMLVAGSTRLDDTTPVKARTPVYWFAWPNDTGIDPIVLSLGGWDALKA